MSEAPRRFGRYLELRSLAAGGMGEIILAEHTGLSGFSKRVAVKRIRTSLARDPGYVELFLNEARIGSFLNHPNIVHIFDVGRHEEELWLVMEYVEGVDLKRLARRARRAGAPLSAPIVAAIAVEILSALDEAHHGGPMGGDPIIHRDLSPENVLVSRSGSVKVLDFGLAKWVPAQSTVPSMEGNMIFGKVRYMPPEQLRGLHIDARADLFSLGATLYETLTGEVPFGRGSANDILARILGGPPQPPSDRHPDADPELDALVIKALNPTPDGRFHSATDMRDAFLEYLDARPQPRLPLESLRRIINKEPSRESGPGLDGRPTELALPVPEHCGKCGGDFRAAFFDDLIVDRCVQCHGVWLEHDEVMRLVGSRETARRTQSSFERAPLDAIVGTCPTDRVALTLHPVPGHPASLEVCPICFGVWFDRDELELLRSGEVASWLRILLDTLSDSGRVG